MQHGRNSRLPSRSLAAHASTTGLAPEFGAKATLASQGAGHRATAKRSESISSRAAVLGREKAPSSGGRGLRVHHAFLTFLPSKTIRGAAIWFRCQKGKGPAEAGRGLSWKEIKMKMLPVTCKSRPF